MKPKRQKRKNKKTLKKSRKNQLDKILTFLTKSKFLLFSIPLFLLSLILSTIFKDLLNIKAIECIYEDNICSSENIAIDSSFYNYNLVNLPKQSVINYYKNNYPQIHSVNLRPKFPRSLLIMIQSRPIFAQVYSHDQNYYFIDEQAMVIKKAYSSQLTTIISESSFEVGNQIIQPHLLSAIETLSLLKNSHLPVKSIEIENNFSLKIELNSSQLVYFSTQKDIAKQVDSLQFILQNSTIDNGQKITSLDLRYDSPVVKSTLY